MPDIIMNKKMVESMFDTVSSAYARIPPEYFIRFGARLVELMPIRQGSRVLDIATGAGAVLISAALQVGNTGCVTGIDISHGMLKEATRAVKVASLTNVTLRKMDAERLEFPDASFDIVTCGLSLFFIPDMHKALREMYRVLKLGGHIGVTFFDKVGIPLQALFRKMTTDYGVRVAAPQRGALTPDEVDALLIKQGFHPLKTQSEAYEIVFKNREEYWSFLLSCGNYLTIQNMKDDVRNKFKEEYFVELSRFMKEDGLYCPSAIVYSIMRK